MWGTNFYLINYNLLNPEMNCLEIVFGIITTLATFTMAVFTIILAGVNKKLAKIEQERHEEELATKIELVGFYIDDLKSYIKKRENNNMDVTYKLMIIGKYVVKNLGKRCVPLVKVIEKRKNEKNPSEITFTLDGQKEQEIKFIIESMYSKNHDELGKFQKIWEQLRTRDENREFPESLEKDELLEKLKIFNVVTTAINMIISIKNYRETIRYKLYYSLIENKKIITKLKK
ncbi:MAG: hypothetical protein HPY53_06500 [Brevinematales bacterium]|nr:hypothetical protein [Brevinematales bacterium]